jgi:hypothetical protein
MMRTLPYRLGLDGKPAAAAKDAEKLGALLAECRAKQRLDSPLFQLLDDIKPLQVSSDRTDVFRQEADYTLAKKAELAAARKRGPEAVAAVRTSLGRLDAVESGVLIDLLLSYSAVKDWQGMINLVAAMPETLRRTMLVQEQLGFALNRAGRGEEAEQVLTSLIAARGPSSETLGILGRVYKDRWEAADKAGEQFEAAALLDKAIDAYRRSFEADWRDHYPGINAVTLMELHDPPDPERNKLIPVVRYSVERRIAGTVPDYWDWATLVELAVLAKDEAGARSASGQALAAVREPWEPETTMGNLRLIREARVRRGEVALSAAVIAGSITRCRTSSNSTVRPPASLRPNGMAMKQSGFGIIVLPTRRRDAHHRARGAQLYHAGGGTRHRVVAFFFAGGCGPCRLCSVLAARITVDIADERGHRTLRVIVVPGPEVLRRTEFRRHLHLMHLDRHDLRLAAVALLDHLARFMPAVAALEVGRRQQDDTEGSRCDLREDLFDHWVPAGIGPSPPR